MHASGTWRLRSACGERGARHGVGLLIGSASLPDVCRLAQLASVSLGRIVCFNLRGPCKVNVKRFVADGLTSRAPNASSKAFCGARYSMINLQEVRDGFRKLTTLLRAAFSATGPPGCSEVGASTADCARRVFVQRNLDTFTLALWCHWMAKACPERMFPSLPPWVTTARS